jgi:glyoxalase/bleomycin resistance protein/dioxygenase superfamily protein
MLGETDAIANLAVKDLNVAKKFYEDTLGFTRIDSEGDELVTYPERQYWFKDPDGNILNIVNRRP